MRSPRLLALACALCALASCDPPRSSHFAPQPPAPAPRATASARPAPSAAPTPAPAPAAASSTAAPVARPPAPSPSAPVAMALERAAALDAQHIYAVGQGRLYARDGERWRAIPLEGALARDVIANRGAIYVLARGVGGNAGHTLILRMGDRETLAPVYAPRVGPAHDPRALAIARDTEMYVGGTLPSLVRVSPRGAEPVEGPEAPVDTLRTLRENVLVAGQHDGRVAVFRWGEWRILEVESYVDTALDAQGFSYVVHGDGAVVVGRPGHEVTPLAGPAAFALRAAAVLRDGRVIAAGDNNVVGLWSHDRWAVRPDAGVRAPLAVLSVSPPMVLGRDGALVALDLAALESAPSQQEAPARARR